MNANQLHPSFTSVHRITFGVNKYKLFPKKRDGDRKSEASVTALLCLSFFTHTGVELKLCMARAGATTKRALLCERWNGCGSRPVYLCCWAVALDASAAKWRCGATAAGWGHSNIKASLSGTSWRWHSSEQQMSGWPTEAIYHWDGFVQRNSFIPSKPSIPTPVHHMQTKTMELHWCSSQANACTKMMLTC